MTLVPRTAWIPPVSPDPRYENLYDRFYAIMGDLAVTEHLAFAYAIGDDRRYGDAARKWILASCRAWQREADGAPDGGKAYAVARLLKGIAVGYDFVFALLTDDERKEVRGTLVRIGHKYWEEYFNTPAILAADFCGHHAIVESASFGVMALALLDEEPEARTWLRAIIRKFEDHLLPHGLASDGAQTEGATFWASTMQYRIFFMDALRRVTGHDMFRTFEKYMNADLALGSIATRKFSGYDQDHANVVLEPSYGQLDYYSPLLLFLAREYRRSTCQYLALWDHSLGAIQRTRYITPHGEQLLFAQGGYAYVWYDATVAGKADEHRLSYHFPSVDEAYLRTSWNADDLLVGVRKGELVMHGGGTAMLIEPEAWRQPPSDLSVVSVADDGDLAVIRCGKAEEKSMSIELHRKERRLSIRRRGSEGWSWWCQGNPKRTGNELHWPRGYSLSVREGTIMGWEPDGYSPKLSVGNGVLTLVDPASMRFPRITILPSAAGTIVVDVRS